MKFRTFLPICFLMFVFTGLTGQNQASSIDPALVRGFKLRNLTSHSTGGRIADIAVDPKNKAIWFAAASSGNVWRTKNAGITWDPVFENYGSYSIGVVEVDPNNSNVVWVGTGENNAQRSVSKGDGVYKSVDGGNSWTNMGLKTSEHIGKIVIDPRNSDVVYVAAQGSVWAPGGERGLYKTVDGGQNWERILHVSENTGISDIIFDPRNPDILLVSSYQRRRHPGILIAGGPDGGIWKTLDAGKNWKKLKGGLPGGDLGRIGLAISPQQPDVLYALIAGTDDTKGFYRSSNLGDNWVKMNDYMVIDAQYYMELYPDPHQFDKVYSVNTIIQVTEDGGRTFSNMNNSNMHVDHHEIIFDSDNSQHMLIGNDGGVYETWDGTKSWRFFDNMPIAQFYRVGIDDAQPFYNVYGGTQDNNTWGAPTRSINRGGIKKSDWIVTVGGDGFQTRVEPNNPNIIYSQSQYGGLVRYDKKSQEMISIKPQPKAGGAPLRWHWDAPLVISPHQPQRIYFAAERLFRSDDRGNSWEVISDDLSLNQDRNKMEVMDRVWGVDAVFKNVWTSPLGTIVSLDESPLVEGLIYAGTDDGQISVTKNGGEDWQRLAPIAGVPANTYVADIHTSRTDANTVFVVYNNHKFGDYNAYIYRSDDAGQSWTSIQGDLPEGEYLWTVYQDHVNPDLLFLGAEYGLYTSVDGGKQWIKFKAGIPTIAIRDLEIQTRENDLVAASFGRGFYILDDYSPLREINPETIAKETYFFPVKTALQYTEARAGGGAFGDSYRRSSNPSFGAVLTYYLKTGSSSLKQKRKQAEAKKVKAGDPVYYPDWEDLAEERMEKRPQVLISIFNEAGEEVQRLNGPASKGIHRVAWNLVSHKGIKVPPGKYTAKLAKVVNGDWQDTEWSVPFEVELLNNSSLPATDPAVRHQILDDVAKLRAKVTKSQRILSKVSDEIKTIAPRALKAPGLSSEDYEKLMEIEKRLYTFGLTFSGNRLMVEKMELIPPSLNARIRNVAAIGRSASLRPTQTHEEDFRIATAEFTALVESYNQFVEQDLKPMAAKLAMVNPSFMLTLDKFR